MRVVVLAGAGPHHQALCGKLAEVCEIVAVVLSSNAAGKTAGRLRHKIVGRALAAGPGKPFVQAWRDVTARFSERHPFEFAGPVTWVDRINDPQTLRVVRESAPDMVVVSGTNIIREPLVGAVCGVSGRGALNLHTGLSPYVRGGPNCTNWCLAEGTLDKIGNTILWLDPGIDTGDLVATERTGLTGREDLAELQWKVLSHGHDLYCRVVAAAAAQRQLPRISQSEVAVGRTFYTRDWNARAMRRASATLRERFGPDCVSPSDVSSDVRTFPFPGPGAGPSDGGNLGR